MASENKLNTDEKIKEEISEKKFDFINSGLGPPPEEIFKTKSVKFETVYYGLNMFFKPAHPFSSDKD